MMRVEGEEAASTLASNAAPLTPVGRGRIDAEAIEIRLANTSMFDFDASGSYLADVCR